MKKKIVAALILASVLAFAIGVNGGWVMGHTYFTMKALRKTTPASSAALPEKRESRYAASGGEQVRE